jgi:hypothetical protein
MRSSTYDALAFAVETNCLHRRIEANFIAELEAVGKRLLRVEDTRYYASRSPLLDSKKPVIYLILSYMNSGHHFFRWTCEIVSKCVHQGEPKITRG